MAYAASTAITERQTFGGMRCTIGKTTFTGYAATPTDFTVDTGLSQVHLFIPIPIGTETDIVIKAATSFPKTVGTVVLTGSGDGVMDWLAIGYGY